MEGSKWGDSQNEEKTVMNPRNKKGGPRKKHPQTTAARKKCLAILNTIT